MILQDQHQQTLRILYTIDTVIITLYESHK